jgi:soluble lytic murein transglycosylase-like protein
MNLNLLRAEWRAVRRASLRLMHHSLSLVGLLSVGVAVAVATHPEYAHAVGRWIVPAAQAPVATAQPALPDPLVGAIAHPGGEAGRLLGLVANASTAAEPSVTPDKVSAEVAHPAMSREQREAISYLSKKYRINSDAIAMLVDAAYVTGKDLGLDPLLLLSVMGVESGFNPFAESTAGASGLMQLMSKVHRDKLNEFGGPQIALNPVVNLRVGAVVLKDCIRRGGSIADGLRL